MSRAWRSARAPYSVRLSFSIASLRCAISASLLDRSACALAASASAARRARRSATIIAWAAARSEGSDSEAGLTSVIESHPSPSASKFLADRARTPGFLRVAPIDPGQKVTELCRRDRHHAIGRARPDEPPPLQPLREQARSLPIVPNHLQKIAAPAAKAKQRTAQRIPPQHLLHLQRQRREALAHVGVARRQPHPHPSGNRDHRRSRTPMTRASALALTPSSTMIRGGSPSTISIRPVGRAEAPLKTSGGGSRRSSVARSPATSCGAITAGTNPTAPAAPRRPRNRRRQENSRLVFKS